MTIKELLTKPHFRFAEYLGEMIINDGYESIEKGPLMSLDLHQQPKVFVDLFIKSLEEFQMITDMFEEFVDTFITTINESFWKHYQNLLEINKLYNSSVRMMMHYLQTHTKDEITNPQLEEIMEKTKLSMTYCDKFDEAIVRLRKYIFITLETKKIKTSELNTNNILDVCEKYSSMMENICSIIDEHNISHLDADGLTSFQELINIYIDGSNDLISFLNEDVFLEDSDKDSTLKSLIVNNNKLKFLSFQVRNFVN